ncbi:hypothetical protein Glove_187g90 [Diversispora epigaea]|uniref:Uncharacterized protein n=1 Tax=Diversispora epigaea TaxID=1348612 RepID=A0A397IQ08_9GLOM|nr:hypothetical protein Glove_187g90 [Diversispora epigaea]
MLPEEWHDSYDVRVNQRHLRPLITSPTDAIIRVASSTICGSDLYLYNKEIPGIAKGHAMDHEWITFIREQVISSLISCGACNYCSKGMFSCYGVLNLSEDMKELSHSHLKAGMSSRVPFADTNLFKISAEDYNTLDDTVGIWAAGPIGLMAVAFAKYREASKIIVVDCITSRLAFAKFKEFKDVVSKILKFFPDGLDVTINVVGFRNIFKLSSSSLSPSLFSSWKHKLKSVLSNETDHLMYLKRLLNVLKKEELLW